MKTKPPWLAMVAVPSLILFTACERRSSSGFHQQAAALLNGTGARYESLRCQGGWTSREMYCELRIDDAERAKVVSGLGLDAKLPYFDGKKRIIEVETGTDPASEELRKSLLKASAGQQWNPSRNGFSSAILIHEKSTPRACLMLSIAYG